MLLLIKINCILTIAKVRRHDNWEKINKKQQRRARVGFILILKKANKYGSIVGGHNVTGEYE